MKMRKLKTENDVCPARRFGRWRRCSLWLWLVPWAFLLSAEGQYTIDQAVIGSGGGTSIGGSYSLRGTVAQPDVGSFSGGSFKLQGGFWAVLSEVVIPGAPEVTIRLLANGSVQICWPSDVESFTLQETSTLQSPAWSSTPLATADHGTMNCVTLPLPVGSRFYRLVK
jgi:hypothetical protein